MPYAVVVAIVGSCSGAKVPRTSRVVVVIVIAVSTLRVFDYGSDYDSDYDNDNEGTQSRNFRSDALVVRHDPQ
jgi:hypothetical protein